MTRGNCDRLHADVWRVTRAVHVEDERTVWIRGAKRLITDKTMAAAVLGFAARPHEPPLVAPLAQLIYSELYTRGTPSTASTAADHAGRALLGELSLANQSKTSWEHGWRLVSMEPHCYVVEKDELHVYARPEQFRVASAEIGCTGALQVGKELLYGSPGFYFAFGEYGDDDSADMSALVRIYFHAVLAGAVPFIRELTAELNKCRVPFRAKVLSNPSAFVRADAAVVYLRQSSYLSNVELLTAIRKRIARHLRPSVPLFTKRVARGVGLAEDSGQGESFGQQRARAAAAGLAAAHAAGATTKAAYAHFLACAFRDHGIDPERPHLTLGNADIYHAWN